MPLVDPFGREITYLRISITDRCNLKCTYCMPADAYHVERDEILNFEEIDRLVRVAVSLGWRKVRLTGGEPLVRKNCVELVRMIGRQKANGLKELVMTSNGILLSRFARDLKDAGLDRVNISLDTLNPERFKQITGYDKFSEVWAGIEAALAAGLTPVKLNTVLIKGVTEDELFDFVDLAREKELDIRFIEFMPFAGNGWSLDQVLESGELKKSLEERLLLHALDPPRDGGPARTFAADGWKGSVSFISPISDRSFCTRCNRVRMTSEGKLRGCLMNEDEMDFRKAIRAGSSDEELARLFQKAISIKPEQHPFHEPVEQGVAVGSADGRGMYRIGG